MLVSVLVRLVPEQLSRGRIVGEVENVATGVVTPVRDIAALTAALRAGDRNVASDDPTPGVEP